MAHQQALSAAHSKGTYFQFIHYGEVTGVKFSAREEERLLPPPTHSRSLTLNAARAEAQPEPRLWEKSDSLSCLHLEPQREGR